MFFLPRTTLGRRESVWKHVLQAALQGSVSYQIFKNRNFLLMRYNAVSTD